MNKRQSQFVIVDAMAIAYKAYFAFINKPLLNSKGDSTSAIYGFMTQLIKIIEDTKPQYLAIASDSKEKTFRHDIYDGYKSSRAVMPEDMVPQIQKIKEIIVALEIPLYILPGYEADDIVGTILKKTESLGIESFAITPDKDYIQLITEKSKIIKPGKTADKIDIIDREKAIEIMGFEPELMIDYLALVGDSSDDIPEFFHNAKLLASCRQKTFQNEYSFPTKVIEYLASDEASFITGVVLDVNGGILMA